MIIGTNYSLQGKSHIKTNTVCQDASIVRDIVGNWVMMATADGVGSCRKSDVGSALAVATAAELIVSSFPVDGRDSGILALLRTAFNAANRRIEEQAEADGEPVEEYDTTLDIVIFNGGRKLYYGHCGDGGIFVLNSAGTYQEITSVQEGEDANSVKPLRCGNDEWLFGIFEDEAIGVVASFTDGIRDKLVPPQYENQKYHIDVPLANIFMFVDLYGMDSNEADPVLSEHIRNSVRYLHSADCPITDDVTMGILINTDVLIEDPPYEEPDLVSIKAQQIEVLYPSMPRIAKRHMLEVYLQSLVEDGSITPDAAMEQLDQYYLLTDEEKAKYTEKYQKALPAEETESVEKTQEKIPANSETSSSD